MDYFGSNNKTGEKSYREFVEGDIEEPGDLPYLILE